MNHKSIGNGHGIGGCLRHVLQGESFIRHIGNDKLIFDFKSGNGTTVKDRSREGNDGTLGAGAAAPTWKRNSLYFDGGDYVDLTGISHGISSGEFTICLKIDKIDSGKTFFRQISNIIYVMLLLLAARTYFGAWRILSDDITVSPIIIQITRDNSGNLECYTNAEIGNKGLSDGGDITYDGSSAVRLCPDYAGTIYSFRILNKCLSEIEAQNEYLVNKFSNN